MREGRGFQKDTELAGHEEHSLFLNWRAGNAVFSFDFLKKNKHEGHLACGRPSLSTWDSQGRLFSVVSHEASGLLLVFERLW